MQEFAAFIMAGRWRAVVLAALFALVGVYFLPMVIVSAAVVGLVLLRRGLGEGLLIAAGAALLTWGLFRLLPPRPGFPFPLAFALWLPLFPAALTLRRTLSQGSALMVLWLLMSGYVVAMHLITGDVVAFWRDWLARAVTNVKGATVYGFEAEGTLRLMNGLVAMFYTLCVTASLLLARWWQSILYHPGGFGEEFLRLRLPRWFVALVVAVVWGAGYVDRILMADLLLVGAAVYLFQGLAVLHALVAWHGASGLWMLPVYGLLLFLPQYSFLGVALLGMLDSLADFRAKAPPAGGE